MKLDNLDIRTSFYKSLRKYIDNIDFYSKALNENTKLRLATSLYKFVNKAITKYIKGQKEHGGDITEKDLDKEINQEIIDLFWYNEGRLWKEQNEAVKRKNSKKKKHQQAFS